MESAARLDYILCDLVIFAGKLNEKLAYGFLEPFVLHLRSIKDQIAKGGYSVTLRPPPSAGNASWFTKATLQRFVRFISTPELLERVGTIEREIQQIENSIQSYEPSNATDADGVDSNLKSNASSKTNGNTDSSPQENSKARLQRVLDIRIAVLQKEQAMAYARALAAGYEMDNLDDLISFSDAFGASRLRDACVNFIDLCKKKNGDKLWIDQIAAMQALPQPDLSYFGNSGIIIAGEDNLQKHDGIVDSSTSDSSASHKSSANNPDPQIPFSWANYMQNVQGSVYQHMPPYPGFVFPGMQGPPPYHPNSMPWLANGKDTEPDDYRNHKSYPKKKGSRSKGRTDNGEQNGDTESSNSSTGSDSSVEERHKKKHGKKSSRKVVIRNINYITSKKETEDSSEETSSGDDYLDEDSIKQQVEKAVGSLEKHHKTSHNRKRKNGNKQKNGQDSSESEENLKSGEGKKGNENWDAFQQLLLKDSSDSVETQAIHIEEEYSATKSSKDAFRNGAEETRKPRSYASDAFLFSERGAGNENNLGAVQNFEDGESTMIVPRKGSNPEEFLLSQRNEGTEYYSQVTPADCASGSILRGRSSDDWIITNQSTQSANGDAIDLGLIDGQSTRLSNGRGDILKKDIIDDSLMIQTSSMDDHFDTQLRFDIDFSSDNVQASPALEGQQSKSETEVVHEPEELYMVLDRDTPVNYSVASWTPEMDYESNVSFNEARKLHPEVEACIESPVASKSQEAANKKTRPGLTRDARSKSLNGPIGRKKPELAAKNTRPAWGSRAAASQSKIQKEEETKKRREQILLERQKRIAERSGGNGTTPLSSKSPGKPNEDLKKLPKPVLRSSTIDRLAAAKPIHSESASPSQLKKGNSKSVFLL
ncbi:hypothetical protein V2J09_007381 [Rumex salicifolius]